MLFFIISMPGIATLITLLLGRELGRKGVSIILLTTVFISTIFSILLLLEVQYSNSIVTINIGEWLNTGIYQFDYAFTIDILSSWVVTTVFLITFLVQVFAVNYMKNDPHSQKFLSTLTAFAAGMILLVTGDNGALILLGWELIGVVSFLLIGFWWDRSSATQASIQAVLVNKIGDIFLTLSLIMIFYSIKTLDHSIIDIIIHLKHNDNTYLSVQNWIAVFLVLAAFGKSAQFIFHTWLPNSMEGPTPVSSLLHAATLVAAGIYLLLRYIEIISISDIALWIALVIGSMTAVFAASSALIQYDIKRIIAYSTCSQFGYLTASIGCSQSESTLLHLVSHSSFKALLFIGAGCIIHSIQDQQDIRKLGGLLPLFPITYSVMFIGTLSIIAIPYSSGFYSKDALLELSFVKLSISHHFFWLLGTLVAGITACYSIRLLLYVFFGTPESSKKSIENQHEIEPILLIPFIALSLLSIFYSGIFKDTLIGVGSGIKELSIVESEFGLDVLYKLAPLITTFIGIIISLLLFSKPQFKLWKGYKWNTTLFYGLNQRWWIDAIYAIGLYWPFMNWSYFISQKIDKGFIDLIGPNGLSLLSDHISKSKTHKVIELSDYILLYSLLIILFLTLLVIT